MENQGKDQQTQQGPTNGNSHMFRSMREYMHSQRIGVGSCIVLPNEHIVIKSHLVPLLPQFHGMENENPYTHIKDFEEGMSPTMKQFLETMCGSDFMGKSPNEALEFFNYVAEISRSWDEPYERDLHKSKSESNSNGGIYMLIYKLK
ncbi:hypothetical protein AAG906_006837 [Vitis piasezkii]